MPTKLLALVLVFGLASCASTLTDELTSTVAGTRASTIHSSESLARTAERLPQTFDELNKILATGAKAAEDARLGQQQLGADLGRVMASTSLAIDRLAALVATFDAAGASTLKVLESVQRDDEATRADRLKIVASLGGITASLQVLFARLEQASSTWDEQAQKLGVEQVRAAKAFGDLGEATARATTNVALVTGVLGKVAGKVEPELTSAAGSMAAILGDLARVTSRFSSAESARSVTVFDVIVGASAGAVVIGVVLLIQFAFRRAVATAVARSAVRD